MPCLRSWGGRSKGCKDFPDCAECFPGHSGNAIMDTTSDTSPASRNLVRETFDIEVEKLKLARDQFEYEKIKSGRFSTASLTLLASLISVASALFGASITGWFTTKTEQVKSDTSISLEKIKFETELVLKAINTDDQLKAVKTLKFFASAGLIPTFESRIQSLVETNNGASIPALSQKREDGEPLPPTDYGLRLSQYSGYLSANESDICNVTFVDNKHFIMNTHCTKLYTSNNKLTVTV
jgi:hypothetical protein